MSKDSSLANLELNPNDADVLIRFVGELNKNIKLVEKNFNVKIFQNVHFVEIFEILKICVNNSSKSRNC